MLSSFATLFISNAMHTKAFVVFIHPYLLPLSWLDEGFIGHFRFADKTHKGGNDSKHGD